MRLNDKKILFYSLILALVILLIFPLIRITFFESSFAGDEAYHNQIIAENLLEQGFSKTENLIDRPYLPNPYNILLAGIGELIGVTIASMLLPLIFGLISVYMFYLILKSFKLNFMRKLIALMFLIISPAFIYLFSVSNAYSLAITLSLIAFYLFIKQEKKYFIISLVLFAITALFGFVHSLILSFILISYSIKDKTRLTRASIITLKMGVISLAYNLAFFIKYNILMQNLALNPEYLVGLVSDLGGIKGFGIFTILLMIFGLYVVWKTKKQPLGYILLIITLASAVLYSTSINFYLVFPFSILAAYGFYTILKMRWTFSLIKQLAVIVIIAGIVFSTVSYINQTSKANPNKELIESLEWLKENSGSEEIVLSHYSRGLWIQSIAERKVISDSLFRKTPNLDKKLDLSNTLFYSRTLKNTSSLLSKNNISYIFLDSEMKSHLVWTREQEGLLFLFRNNETFKNVYKKENIEIWKVI